jgi:4'-phosphopantetheinyl transferase
LSTEKQNAISRFRFEADKKLSLISDLFVRSQACVWLNKDNSMFDFQTDRYGKPYLAGFPTFQYNLSHTRNAIAVAFSEHSVGVDIEKVKRCNLDIAKRFFCQKELAYIQSNIKCIESRFYQIWTKKEAYVKWIGKGLSNPLSSFDTTDPVFNINFACMTVNDYIISMYSEVEPKEIKWSVYNESQIIDAISEQVNMHR